MLADEPTGALDSHSSAQVMKLFTDISNDCLVLDGSHTKENHYGQDICQKERVIYGLILFNIR